MVRERKAKKIWKRGEWKKKKIISIVYTERGTEKEKRGIKQAIKNCIWHYPVYYDDCISKAKHGPRRTEDIFAENVWQT